MISDRRIRACSAVLLVLLPLLCMVQFIPRPPTRLVAWDSAGVIYIGKALLAGHVYYRDVWDHKPPLFGYLNAFALAVGHGSLWAVWAIDVLALAVALSLFYFTAARMFGRVPAILGLAAFAAALVDPLDQASITELYALPLQCGILFLFSGTPEKESAVKRFAAIGALTGALLLLRPNLIGTSVAVLAGSFVFAPAGARLRLTFLRALAMTAGFVPVVAACIAPVAAQGALRDMYEAVIRFNARYSGVAPWSARVRSLWKGVREVSSGGTLPVAIWGACFAGISRPGRAWRARNFTATVTLALLIEMALACVSGKGFSHYFITWAPALALLCAASVAVLIELLPPSASGRDFAALAVLSTAVVLLLYDCGNYYIRYQYPTNLRGFQRTVPEVASYIRSHTSDQDRIYMWGEANALYVLSGRFSASPYFYNTAEKWDTPQSRRQVLSRIASDLERNRPKYIIDTSFLDEGFPPLDPEGRRTRPPFRQVMDINPGQIPTESAEPIFGVIDHHYELLSLPQFGAWRIFRLKD